MTETSFTANVRKMDDRAIIDLHGEINAQADQVLNLAYAEADRYHPEAIALNFSAVEYINSTGIALIVGLLAMARKDHRRLVVYGLSDHYVQIFQITRLSDFMDILQDEPSALMN